MATELGEGVWWIDLRTVNAFLVVDESLTLVDAGMPWDTASITEAIAETDHSVGDIDRVLVTHYDLDHVGALADFVRPGETEVYVGAADAPLVTGDSKPSLGSRKSLFQRVVGRLASTVESVTPLSDAETVGSFTAYHTPGHTPGHTVYVSEDLGVAFLGDLVRESDGRLEASPWIISADTTSVSESIRRLVAEELEFEIAAMGHGTPFRQGGDDRLAALVDRQ